MSSPLTTGYALVRRLAKFDTIRLLIWCKHGNSRTMMRRGFRMCAFTIFDRRMNTSGSRRMAASTGTTNAPIRGGHTRQAASVVAQRVLVAKDIRAIAINEDYAFFGTPRGISRYDKTTDTWLSYTTRDGLRHNYVSSLLLVGNELWCGTYGGVSRYNLVLDRWMSLTTADGLCDNRVNALTRDGNNLWIATQSGVSRFRYHRGNMANADNSRRSSR